MRNRGKINIILIFVFALCFYGPVLAHQPQIVGSAAGVVVKDPETSKAYYGRLNGVPAVYTIDADKPFHLYVQLLAPQTDNARTDFSWVVSKDGQQLAGFESSDSLWSVMYEPFGNDYYYQGPEFETDAAPGVYTIQISDPDNQGVYALAVGKNEVITLAGFLNTLAALPALKSGYFNEPAWTAYNNFTGLFALAAVIITGIVLYILIKLIFTWRLKKKLDREYKTIGEGSRRA